MRDVNPDMHALKDVVYLFRLNLKCLSAYIIPIYTDRNCNIQIIQAI